MLVISATSAETILALSTLMPQDLSCITWRLCSSGVHGARVLSVIAFAARACPNDSDAQSLGNIARALDVLLNRAQLQGYLDAASQRYCQIAKSTPETTGMSWVEFQSLMADQEGEVAKMISERFSEEVGQPVTSLLLDIACAQNQDHNVAMSAIAEYAPKHMLPHLGLPFTREALKSLGVACSPDRPSEAIREECWRTGMQ